MCGWVGGVWGEGEEEGNVDSSEIIKREKKKAKTFSHTDPPPSPHTQVMHCVSDAEGCSLLCWCSTYLDRHGLLFVSTLFPPRVTKKETRDKLGAVQLSLRMM